MLILSRTAQGFMSKPAAQIRMDALLPVDSPVYLEKLDHMRLNLMDGQQRRKLLIKDYSFDAETGDIIMYVEPVATLALAGTSHPGHPVDA